MNKIKTSEPKPIWKIKCTLGEGTLWVKEHNSIYFVDKDTEEKTVMELISKEYKINKNFINKNINKVFFVKNRLINILIND